MTNIVNIKIDLDDPRSWINAEAMLRNLSVANDCAKRAGVVLTTEQLIDAIQVSNDKLPSIPLGGEPTPLSTPIADSKKIQF